MSLLPRPTTLPSNAQLSALLDSVDELLMLVDVRGRLSFCNRSAHRLLGCESGQLLASALGRLDAASRGAVQAAIAAGRQDQPLVLRLADGRALVLTPRRVSGSGWALRGPAVVPLSEPLNGPMNGPMNGPINDPINGPVSGSPQPPLAAHATSELIRLLWDSPQPLTVQDTGFVVRAANRAFFEVLGKRPEQVLGQDLIDHLAPEERDDLLQSRARWLAALAAGHQPERLAEQRLPDGHGGDRWFRFAPRWVSADDGAPLLLALLHDVTAERQARHQAEHSGHELERWFDLSPIGMLVYDGSGLVVRSNAAFESLVGRSPVLLRDMPADLCRLLAWEGSAPHADLRLGAPPIEVRAAVQLPDGRRQHLRARLRAFSRDVGIDPPAGPARLRVMAVVEDRSLEDEHDLARLEIGALMDTASIGVATYEPSRGWLNNRPARTPAGASGTAAADALAGDGGVAHRGGGLPTGALQAIGRDQVAPESRAEFERLQQALRDGRRVQVRYAVTMPGLGQRWLMTRVEPGALTGGRNALSVVTLDVTEQEQAQRSGAQLLRELSTILEGTSAGIAYLRGERLVRSNRRFEAMLGLPPGAAAGALVGDLLADQPAALALLRQALDGTGRHEIELSRPGPDGLPVWFALSASNSASHSAIHTAAQASDTATGRTPASDTPELVVVLSDVSSLKAQQARLEALARERELMFNLSDVGLVYLRGGQIERGNEAMAALTGHAVGDLLGMPLWALFADLPAYQAQWPLQQQALRATGRWQGERLIRRRDGRLLWVLVSKRLVDEADPAAGLICSYVDVDERRRAREAVQLQAERTRAILDSVLVGIVTVGEGGIEWMNRSARRMFGGELVDFVGAPIDTVATDDAHHPLRATHYRQALGDGQAETFECRLRGRDGREFWVVGNAVVTGPGGAGSQITFALLDIERRRQAEVSIERAQTSLQRIIDTAPLAIALFDAASGRVLRLNQMAAQFFGRPVDAVLGQAPESWFAPADAQALRQDLAAAAANPGDGLRRELARASGPPSEDDKAGSQRLWDMRIVTLAATGDPQLLLVASEVTEQRIAEQARFDAAVSQREMLVKEVHHRIKNNLQGVAGLLQQTAARRPEVAGLISEAVGQVQAIAQVHGLQVGVSGPLRIKPLVEAITASVQRMFGRPIQVAVEGTPPHRFALPEAESIPIALTINELLTNAIKHSPPGTIRCVLHCDEARLAISVHNPGQLPAGFSLAQVPPGVSGLGLVRALLPRRTATLTLLQTPTGVEARIVLVPPSITLLEPL